MRTPLWRPILDGVLRAQVEAVISEIAVDLRAHVTLERHLTGDLGSGAAGIALFFHYLERARPRDPFAGTAAELLERAAATVCEEELPFGLYGGIGGVGWVCQHVWRFGTEDDTLDEIDAGICRLLATDACTEFYDLISGLTGLGVYGLERWPAGRSREILQGIADRLVALARPVEPGLAWLTPPPPGAEGRDARFPDGYYNCGAAHGVPGVLVVLAACARRDIATDAAMAALGSGLRWLLRQESTTEGRTRFPTVVSLAGEPVPSRLAWCYGDPGIAGLLACAARELEDGQLMDRALSVAHHAATVGPELDGIVDTPLCHGTAGVAHIFNRLHQATGDAACVEAARAWYRRLLEMRTPGRGLGGFQRCRLDVFDDSPGFLEGSAGVGLALLAAVSDVAPDWDRVLLLSLAPA